MASEEEVSQAVTADSEVDLSMDERMAACLHLQHKQEVNQLMAAHPVTNADAEFRRGLEELVRDHLNTCMAIASCSSANDGGSNSLSRTPSISSVHDESSSHSQHHHQSSSSEEDEPHLDGASQSGTSSSGHHHHHQFDLSVHIDGQPGEAAGGEEVDMLACSVQLGDSGTPNNSPSRSQSRILSRWDARQAQEMITTMERQARESELLALASLHTVSMLDASFLQESASPRSHNAFERPQRRASSLVQMWRGLEGDRGLYQDVNRSHGTETTDSETGAEVPQGVIEPEENHQIETYPEENDHHEVEVVADDQADGGADTRSSPDDGSRGWEVDEPGSVASQSQQRHDEAVRIGEAERERVRQIMQRWMMQAGVGETGPSSTSSPSSGDRQGERERVRQLAREWVRASSQHSAVLLQGRADLTQQQGNSPPGPQGSHAEFGDDSIDRLGRGDQSWHARRYQDTQLGLDLLMRAELERQRELQGLSEHRAVSDFAHRNRLQSFLRGRFLRGGANDEEERRPSLAAGEIGQLRQRRAVSGLREGFRFRLETILAGQVNDRHAEAVENGRDALRRRQQRAQYRAREPEGLDRDRAHLGVGRDWHGIAAARRIRELEDTTAYNMELRELLSRRSVTTVLASEFRDRLDLLIESFIQRSGRSARPWNVNGGGGQQQRQQQQAQAANVGAGNVPRRTIPPPPPPPPPALQWPPVPQQPLWGSRVPQPVAEMVNEGQGSSDLRTDVGKLQRAFGDLQRLMETCMEMQLELQRSVRQEVAGALHRAYGTEGVPAYEIDGTKWATVRKGTCCICCDKAIDSLLYRCGHMCTCLKCASVLLKNSGKCPMCRAPILEVVRAFTVA